MHRNARLTPRGRLVLVTRIATGRPVAHVAAEMGVSRATAHKWWRRYRAEGVTGLEDRSSRPCSCPHRTSPAVERRIVALRRRHKLGPARLGSRIGVAPSTVHRVLVRHGLQRLAWMDRPTGRVIRRIQTTRPGELVHVDVKKLGRIPRGGGWRAHGREATRFGRERRSRGMAYVHSAVDAHTRIAFSQIHDDERGETAARFFADARLYFDHHGIQGIEAVLTDNAKAYGSAVFQAALGDAEHRCIRPYRPQTNGKVERYNRTLLDEWAYVRTYRSDDQRTRALDRWLHNYNHHRGHTALGGQPPISRVDNVAGHYT